MKRKILIGIQIGKREPYFCNQCHRISNWFYTTLQRFKSITRRRKTIWKLRKRENFKLQQHFHLMSKTKQQCFNISSQKPHHLLATLHSKHTQSRSNINCNLLHNFGGISPFSYRSRLNVCIFPRHSAAASSFNMRCNTALTGG